MVHNGLQWKVRGGGAVTWLFYGGYGQTIIAVDKDR